MHDEFPLASCLCLTYGRPQVLREAIWCFLQQDWPNKELVVVNDHPEALYLDRPYPGVRIYNCRKRFGSLGVKRNASVQLARGDYLFVWDDDDLYLPWRLSDSMRHLLANPEKWTFKPRSAFTSTNNRNYRVVKNLFHSQLAMRRVAFDQIGGYTDMNSGQDKDFEARLPKDRWIRHAAPLHELIYVYRWGNNVTHISGLGMDRPGKPTGWERVAELAGQAPGGLVAPGFEQDYWQDLADWAAHAPKLPPEEVRLLTERLRPYHQPGPAD